MITEFESQFLITSTCQVECGLETMWNHTHNSFSNTFFSPISPHHYPFTRRGWGAEHNNFLHVCIIHAHGLVLLYILKLNTIKNRVGMESLTQEVEVEYIELKSRIPNSACNI